MWSMRFHHWLHILLLPLPTLALDAPHQSHPSVILRRMFVYWIFIFKLWIFLSRIYNILWIKDAMSGSVWFWFHSPSAPSLSSWCSMRYKFEIWNKVEISFPFLPENQLKCKLKILNYGNGVSTYSVKFVIKLNWIGASLNYPLNNFDKWLELPTWTYWGSVHKSRV